MLDFPEVRLYSDGTITLGSLKKIPAQSSLWYMIREIWENMISGFSWIVMMARNHP